MCFKRKLPVWKKHSIFKEWFENGLFIKLTFSAMILRELDIRLRNWFINPNWDWFVFLKTLRTYLRFRKFPLKEVRLKTINGFREKIFERVVFERLFFTPEFGGLLSSGIRARVWQFWYQSGDMILGIFPYASALSIWNLT